MSVRVKCTVAAVVAMAALEPLSNIQAEPAVVRRPAARRRSAAPPVDAEARARAVDQVAQFLSDSAEIYVENAGALVPFFEQLYRYQQGERHSIHVLHYGDSHTAADDWPGVLRSELQQRFGDGGSGFSLAGRPWNSYRRLDVKSWGSSGWYTDGLVGRYGNGYYGLGGVSLSTSRPNEWVSLEANCETIEIYYLIQPGGGSFTFSHNGSPVETISTDGPLGPGYYTYKVPAGVHRFDLSTRDRAPVRLHGWVAETGRGLTWETLGINGAQASIAFRWNEDLMAGHVARRDPALVVFAYGTNEADSPDWTKESYRDMFATLLNRFRKAAPAATLLVLGPPDRMIRRGRSWISHDRLDMIVEAQREAALGTGCAFLDLRAKMGGKGSMEHWVLAGLGQHDRVHFTGPGYRLLGQTMFEELIGHYGTFVKVRERLVSLNPEREANGQTSENN
jgi:lysophospholipase L1-like esterase